MSDNLQFSDFHLFLQHGIRMMSISDWLILFIILTLIFLSAWLNEREKRKNLNEYYKDKEKKREWQLSEEKMANHLWGWLSEQPQEAETLIILRTNEYSHKWPDRDPEDWVKYAVDTKGVVSETMGTSIEEYCFSKLPYKERSRYKEIVLSMHEKQKGL